MADNNHELNLWTKCPKNNNSKIEPHESGCNAGDIGSSAEELPKLPWFVRAQTRVVDILTPLMLKPDPEDEYLGPRLTWLGMLVAYTVTPFVIVAVLLRHPRRCWRMVTGKPEPMFVESGFPNTDAEDTKP